jgi:hypothetical protein
MCASTLLIAFHGINRKPGFREHRWPGDASAANLPKRSLVSSRSIDTPSQLRNIESRLPCYVIDRSQLIHDIFARHAKTSEGQLQVELPQLEYQLPRPAGRGRAMSKLGGGIGTRGPAKPSSRRIVARSTFGSTTRVGRTPKFE